jgi:hypothetical protein
LLCASFGARGYASFFNVFNVKFDSPPLYDRSYSAFADEVNLLKRPAQGEFSIPKPPPWVEQPSFLVHTRENDETS